MEEHELYLNAEEDADDDEEDDEEDDFEEEEDVEWIPKRFSLFRR